MAETEEERAKRELREAVRRATEDTDTPASSAAIHDAQIRWSSEMAGEKSRRS